ncbi:potassium channel SKOR-like [Hibiscus syriacus]|uniref:Potassium channel SKOR-like n=1 Tax=Hibiscus syriacus TaxID=106335 RepID=A0A6A2XUX0_HIBSY|nr:potassium channel SKOR-like [Hibiscus syriacus]
MASIKKESLPLIGPSKTESRRETAVASAVYNKGAYAAFGYMFSAVYQVSIVTVMEEEPVTLVLEKLFHTLPLAVSYLLYMLITMESVRGINVPMYTTLRRTTVAFTMTVEYLDWKETHHMSLAESTKVPYAISSMGLDIEDALAKPVVVNPCSDPIGQIIGYVSQRAKGRRKNLQRALPKLPSATTNCPQLTSSSRTPKTPLPQACQWRNATAKWIDGESRAARFSRIGCSSADSSRRISRSWSEITRNVGIIIFGAFVAGARDLSFDAYSYTIVFVANICTAIYLASIAHIGKSSGLNSFGLMWCNGIICAPILFLWTLFRGDLEAMMSFPYLYSRGFQFVILLSCIMAFLINYFVFLNTTLNSALTDNMWQFEGAVQRGAGALTLLWLLQTLKVLAIVC